MKKRCNGRSNPSQHGREAPWSISKPWYDRELKKYAPGADFERQIEEHKDMHGTECELVECQYDHPDFNALSEKQLGFYLYYRDRFLGGDAISTDVGYAWLLLVELINSRDDPEKTLDLLIRLSASCQDDRVLFQVGSCAKEAMFSYAAANDLDLPRAIPDFGSIWEGILISELLLPEPDRLSTDMVDLLTAGGHERYYVRDGDNSLPSRLFDAAMPAVDAEMRRLTGKGILETYGEEKTVPIVLFELRKTNAAAIPYFYDRDCIITYTAPDEQLKTFLNAMLKYCELRIAEDVLKRNGPAANAVFAEEYRRIVDGIFDQGDIAEPLRQPRGTRGSVRDFCIEDADFPLVADGSSFSDEAPPDDFLGSMIEYAAKEPSGECRYVRSGFKRPDYSRLSPEALEYYLWWRKCAREGKHGVTDEGYLWLYRCELINAYEDRRYVLDQLAGLARAYDRYFSIDEENRSSKPGMTYMYYALVNSCAPDPTVYSCPLTSCLMIERLLNGETDVPVSRKAMLRASDIGRKSDDDQILASFDDDCAIIAARSLARVNEIRKSRGCGVLSSANVRPAFIRLEVLYGLQYHHWPDEDAGYMKCRYMDLHESREFKNEMRALFKAVIEAVGDREKPKRRRKPRSAFDVELDGILREEVDRLFSEKEMAAAREKAMSISMDESEVRRAQADLDHVASIMSTEEKAEEKMPEADKEAPEAVPDNPWQAFADRLDKGQKEYMRKALAGTLRSAKPMIEDAINAAAMDTVKDTVVENGKAFDEYADEMKEALGLGGE